jgi:hypothetical protein
MLSRSFLEHRHWDQQAAPAKRASDTLIGPALPAVQQRSAMLTRSALSALCSDDGSWHCNRCESGLAAGPPYNHTKRDRLIYFISAADFTLWTASRAQQASSR